MKSTKKYYFTVEGETEQWYLKWLQDRINETEVWHLSDYESDDPIHTKQFTETMDNMKAAKEVGKQITYKFGYTNLTFDLWIILHKADCNASYTHRKNYITPLNRAYGEQFEYMKEYKHEDNFKRCLGKLELSNVIEAVNRAKRIMVRNEENGYKLLQYKGYKYYKENPSMAIHEIIGKILKDCELI